MEKFYACTKIPLRMRKNEVLSNEIELLVPKKGECILIINQNFGTLILRIKKEKKFLDSEDEEEIITHKVLFFFIYNLNKKFSEF